ncbi:hypothetical protein HPP92_002522 [Vanilla planifolia]|uniref:Uncharacterized protein n=1 Tax=Vanilla planifolia TaxID=51239 RepID=A0A835VMF9_VANPL|nr:hypothetical protein HPP92_002522 [Vanilla planifolia]
MDTRQIFPFLITEVDSMGGVIDFGVSLDIKTSPHRAAITKAQEELRSVQPISLQSTSFTDQPVENGLKRSFGIGFLTSWNSAESNGHHGGFHLSRTLTLQIILEEAVQAVLSKKDHESAVLSEARIIEANLKRAAALSKSSLSTEKRHKCHWDYVLEEKHGWLNDFIQVLKTMDSFFSLGIQSYRSDGPGASAFLRGMKVKQGLALCEEHLKGIFIQATTSTKKKKLQQRLYTQTFMKEVTIHHMDLYPVGKSLTNLYLVLASGHQAQLILRDLMEKRSESQPFEPNGNPGFYGQHVCQAKFMKHADCNEQTALAGGTILSPVASDE